MERVSRRFVWGVWLAWSAVFAGLIVRFLRSPRHPTTFDLYRVAGEHWRQGAQLYKGSMGFVYSPAVAAFFAPFSALSRTAGTLGWLAVNLGLFLAGLHTLLRAQVVGEWTAARQAAAFLLLIPLTIGNLDVAQANPLVIGLLMLAIALAQRSAWCGAALCIALATTFKIYPLALGLLLMLIAPPRFLAYLTGWLAALALLPFALQAPGYVTAQWQDWLHTRMADNRLRYSGAHAPLDLWMLLSRVAGWHVGEWWYRAVQIGAGAAIAALAVLGRFQGWSRARLLGALFLLGCVWMTLCGPATEGLTYLLLAPPVVLGFLAMGRERSRRWPALLAGLALLLLLVAVWKNSFSPALNRVALLHGMQPLAAVLFAGAAAGWIFDDVAWESRS